MVLRDGPGEEDAPPMRSYFDTRDQNNIRSSPGSVVAFTRTSLK